MSKTEEYEELVIALKQLSGNEEHITIERVAQLCADYFPTDELVVFTNFVRGEANEFNAE